MKRDRQGSQRAWASVVVDLIDYLFLFTCRAFGPSLSGGIGDDFRCLDA